MIGNALLIWATSKRKQGEYILNSKPESQATKSQSWFKNICNVLLISFASIIVPSGYSNDVKMYHPRIKGRYRMIQ